MRIAIPKETHPGENRIPLTPSDTKKLVRAGAEVVVETGMGAASGFVDHEYTEAGATLSGNRDELLGSADIVLRLRKPQLEDIHKIKKALFISVIWTHSTSTSWSTRLKRPASPPSVWK